MQLLSHALAVVLITLRWFHTYVIAPWVRWWEESVLGAWEEWVQSLIRQGFEEATRFLNGVSAWFLELFDYRYRDTLRRSWDRHNPWQRWWKTVEDRPSTLNALVATVQTHRSSQGGAPTPWERPGTASDYNLVKAASVPVVKRGASGAWDRLAHLFSFTSPAHGFSPEVHFGRIASAATLSSTSAAPAAAPQQGAASSAALRRTATPPPARSKPRRFAPFSRWMGYDRKPKKVVVPPKPDVFLQQSGMGVVLTRRGLLEDAKLWVELRVSRMFDAARALLRTVFMMPKHDHHVPHAAYSHHLATTTTLTSAHMAAAAAAAVHAVDEHHLPAGRRSASFGNRSKLLRSRSAHVRLAESALQYSDDTAAGLNHAHSLRRSHSYSYMENVRQHLADVSSAGDVVKLTGYPLEEHAVTTEDGYILKMERIPRIGAKDVVFFMHGVMDTSMGWVSAGVTGSQAFAAWDAGFDVWLGNSRSNAPRLHQDPAKGRGVEYWRYNCNHLGMYDMPAQLDHIHNVKCAELGAGEVNLDLNLGPLAGSIFQGQQQQQQQQPLKRPPSNTSRRNSQPLPMFPLAPPAAAGSSPHRSRASMQRAGSSPLNGAGSRDAARKGQQSSFFGLFLFNKSGSQDSQHMDHRPMSDQELPTQQMQQQQQGDDEWFDAQPSQQAGLAAGRMRTSNSDGNLQNGNTLNGHRRLPSIELDQGTSSAVGSTQDFSQVLHRQVTLQVPGRQTFTLAARSDVLNPFRTTSQPATAPAHAASPPAEFHMHHLDTMSSSTSSSYTPMPGPASAFEAASRQPITDKLPPAPQPGELHSHLVSDLDLSVSGTEYETGSDGSLPYPTTADSADSALSPAAAAAATATAILAAPVAAAAAGAAAVAAAANAAGSVLSPLGHVLTAATSMNEADFPDPNITPITCITTPPSSSRTRSRSHAAAAHCQGSIPAVATSKTTAKKGSGAQPNGTYNSFKRSTSHDQLASKYGQPSASAPGSARVRPGPQNHRSSEPYRLRAVGHSLGGLSLLIYCWMRGRQQRPSHIHRLILLTPAGFHVKMPMIAYPVAYGFWFLAWCMSWFWPRFAMPVFIPTVWARAVMFRVFQDVSRIPSLIELFRQSVKVMFSGDVSEWDLAMQMPHYNAQAMPAVSLHTILHLVQIRHASKFQLYNYGSRRANQAAYGTAKPPDVASEYWRLGCPVDLVAGAKDGIIPPDNIRCHWAKMKESGVKVTYKEFDFGHLDFTFAVKEDLKLYLLKLLRK